jgi:signal transduction histidine kinase
MRPATSWQALTQRRFLASAWPWRAVAYLASGILTGVLGLVAIAAAFVVSVKLVREVIGLPLLLAPALASVPMADIERRRLRMVDTEPAANPHARPGRPGLRAWLGARWREPATWRELAYTIMFVFVLWPLDAVVLAVGIGVPIVLLFFPAVLELAGPGAAHRLLPIWRISSIQEAWLVVPAGAAVALIGLYVTTALAGAQGALTRQLLAPRDEQLGRRVVELTRSRARLADAFEAERRRIERDLHDGAQQRLVALSMTLGLARVSQGQEAADLVLTAHEQAKLALEEIRDLIRGIHPRVLADRGLVPAVAEIADRSAVPVRLDLDLPYRLPEPIETAAYFVICEALANVAKHSQATQAVVEGGISDGELTVQIQDNGVGGADAGRGSGIAGLADRIAVVAGRMALSSPAGGPTILRVEIPCGPPP